MIGKNDMDKGATSGSCRFCFVIKKESFWVAKGFVLGCKRSPFGE